MNLYSHPKTFQAMVAAVAIAHYECPTLSHPTLENAGSTGAIRRANSCTGYNHWP